MTEETKTCKECDAGNKPIYRKRTGEYIHEFVRRLPTGVQYSSTICTNPPKEGA